MMAKMFYSLEEAAQRLGKSEADVREMAKSGEITEFRDGDRLIFKVDQIDLLTGGDDEAGMSSMIPLTDTSAGSMAGLEESHIPSEAPAPAAAPAAAESEFEVGLSPASLEESAINLEPAKAPGSSGSSQGLSDFDNAFSLEESDVPSGSGEMIQEASGIAVFDADELGSADPMAQTQMADGGIEGGLNLDQLGSGSGLMDLTRESDDTSLGAEGLLDELYPGDDTAPDETVASGDLFEGGPTVGELEEEGEGAAVAVAAAEAYDGKWSGFLGGVALAMVIAGVVGAGMLLMNIAGAAPSFLTELPIGGAPVGAVYAGVPIVIALVIGGLGFMMGSKE